MFLYPVTDSFSSFSSKTGCLKLSKVCASRSLPIFVSLANTSTGVLVECDPSIKAIILKIDQEKHDYIVEDLDDQTLVIKESQLQRLKVRLGEVCVALTA